MPCLTAMRLRCFKMAAEIRNPSGSSIHVIRFNLVITTGFYRVQYCSVSLLLFPKRWNNLVEDLFPYKIVRWCISYPWVHNLNRQICLYYSFFCYSILFGLVNSVHSRKALLYLLVMFDEVNQVLQTQHWVHEVLSNGVKSTFCKLQILMDGLPAIWRIEITGLIGETLSASPKKWGKRLRNLGSTYCSSILE